MAEGEGIRELIGGEYYVFRDAVHNLIAIDNEREGRALRRLLRTKELQRLRRIRQTGLAFLVYSSLEGSRFAHALGAYAVARKLVYALKERQPRPEHGMAVSLQLDDRTCRAFCVAALLHDIGHAPFSHVWEEFLEGAAERAGQPSPGRSHELMGTQIVEADSTEIGQLLRDRNEVEGSLAELRQDVLWLLRGKHPLDYLVRLLSGNLDVDRLDFMARDTRGAGVTYGFHELEWIIRSLRFARVPERLGTGAKWVVALDGRKGLHTLKQFLNARVNMYRQVYLHKTVRIASAMLLLALRRASDLAGQGRLRCPSEALQKYLTNPFDLKVADLIDLDDSDVWQALKAWATVDDSILSELASRLLRRDLYKGVDLDGRTYDSLRQLSRPENGRHLDVLVAARRGISLSLASYYYALDRASFDLVGGESEGGEGTILILEAGRFGPKFRPIRDYWVEEVSREAPEGAPPNTSVSTFLLVGHPAVINDLREFAARVKLASESRATPDPPDPPDGYTILGPLAGAGASKEALLPIEWMKRRS